MKKFTTIDGELLFLSGRVFQWSACQVLPAPLNPDLQITTAQLRGNGGHGEPKMFLEANLPHIIKIAELEDALNAANEKIKGLEFKQEWVNKNCYTRHHSAFRRIQAQ